MSPLAARRAPLALILRAAAWTSGTLPTCDGRIAARGACRGNREDPEPDHLVTALLAEHPAVADLVMKDPAWLDVYAADSDIMTAVAASSAQGVFVVTPSGVATLTRSVQEAVISTKAPKALATCTAEATIPQPVAKQIELPKETMKPAIGGLHVVDQMTRAELKALADRIAAAVPQPVVAH